MTEKQCKNQKRLIVSIQHVTTADADERLSHAIDILLKAAARRTSVSGKSTIAEEKKVPRYAPNEEGLAEAERV